MSGHPQSHLEEREKRTWLFNENEAVVPSELWVLGLGMFFVKP